MSHLYRVTPAAIVSVDDNSIAFHLVVNTRSGSNLTTVIDGVRVSLYRSMARVYPGAFTRSAKVRMLRTMLECIAARPHTRMPGLVVFGGNTSGNRLFTDPSNQFGRKQLAAFEALLSSLALGGDEVTETDLYYLTTGKSPVVEPEPDAAPMLVIPNPPGAYFTRKENDQ